MTRFVRTVGRNSTPPWCVFFLKVWSEGVAMKAAAAVKRALGVGLSKKMTIPILVRVWQEDGVWNLSAFDIPIVVFDEDLEQARKYFEEAACSHFLTLASLGKLETTATELLKIAKERGFYEERIKPRQLVERFDYSPDSESLCACV
jgi:hypothetical protein